MWSSISAVAHHEKALPDRGPVLTEQHGQLLPAQGKLEPVPTARTAQEFPSKVVNHPSRSAKLRLLAHSVEDHRLIPSLGQHPCRLQDSPIVGNDLKAGAPHRRFAVLQAPQE